jgi:hypothetical protein
VIEKRETIFLQEVVNGKIRHAGTRMPSRIRGGGEGLILSGIGA